MESLSLFNIGFRCENIYNTLKDYKEGKPINKLILDDSNNIITDCFLVEKNITEHLSLSEYEVTEFLPLVFEILGEKSFADLKKSLKEIQDIVDKIKHDTSGIDVKKALDFFNSLSNICLSRNNTSLFDSCP